MNKILKVLISRLHLNEWVYRCECRKMERQDHPMLTVDEALQMLKSIHPDPQNSCICQCEFDEADCDLEVIVPCYNADLYVEDCIDSILNQQTRFTVFVTAVNDGSKDWTREVLKKYEKNNRVHIIDQDNKGHSGARNTAIAQAHGKYLMFVDSDDVLLPGVLEDMLALAEKTNADVVDSGHVRFADPITTKGVVGNIKRRVYDATVKPYTFAYDENAKGVSGYPCGKIIKRSIFQNIQFPQGYWFEDSIMWMTIAPLYNRMATLNKPSFRYRMNPFSVSHTFGEKPKTIDTIDVTLQLLKDRDALGIEMTQSDFDMLMYQIRMNAQRLCSLSDKVQYAAFVIQRDLICNRFSKWEPTKDGMKTLKFFLVNNNFEGYKLWCQWH